MRVNLIQEPLALGRLRQRVLHFIFLQNQNRREVLIFDWTRNLVHVHLDEASLRRNNRLSLLLLDTLSRRLNLDLARRRRLIDVVIWPFLSS